MAPGSVVLFSTNHQRFEPRLEGLAVKNLIELTPKTIPKITATAACTAVGK